MKTRDRERTGALIFMLVGAGIFIVMGFGGWAINGIPAHYLGLFFLVFAGLGLCKVNIWSGGPLDPRRDAAALAERERNRNPATKPRSWSSVFGTGALLYGIKRTPDGRVEFTVWFSVVFIPLIPISSWSVGRVGELAPDGFHSDGYKFADVRRIDSDWFGRLKTFTAGLLIVASLVIPVIILLYRTDGRAATNIEMVFVFASAGLPTVIILLVERYRRKMLLPPPAPVGVNE